MTVLTPPIAKVVRPIVGLRGDDRVDDYVWLRDRPNTDVITYLEADNAYPAAMMRHTEPLQETLYDEMLARINEDDSKPPGAHG